MALVIATRWRCPPESLTPRSPTMVSRPWGEPLDELEGIRLHCGLPDLFLCGLWPAIGDVLAYAPMEEERLLRDIGDLAPERALRAGRDVLPVDENPALLHV